MFTPKVIRFWGLPLTFLALILLPVTLRAAALPIEVRTGDLKAYLESVPVPNATSSDKYTTPTMDELATWRAVVQNVIDGKHVVAAELAQEIGYQVIYFRDTTTTPSQHIVLREVSATPGWHGVYAFRLNPVRNLVIESPHPLFDGTRVQGIDLYLETESLAFMQAGTHRNNHPDESPCDGGFTSGDKYRVSDMAHVVDSFFQVAHEEIHMNYLQAVCLSVHGMAAATHTSDVIISNGTNQERDFADSLSLQLTAHMNQLLVGDPGGRFAVSHQEPAANYPLAGTTNKQGRFSNGSPNPCSQNAPSATNPERFIHLEQSPAVRNLPRSNWDFVTESLNAVMPLWTAMTVPPPPAPELIAYWPFDGTTSETISARDGAATPPLTFASGRPDRVEGALNFNGISDYVTLPNFDYSGDHEEFTIMLWFESSSSGEPFQYLVSQGPMGITTGGTDMVNLPHSFHIYLNDGGNFRMRFTTGDGTHWLYNGSNDLLDGQWHHVALTYSFEDGAAVYLDGNLEAAFPDVSGGSFKPEGPIFVGARSDLGAGRFFGRPSGDDGRINDIRLFNRALSQSEIESQYIADQVATSMADWLQLQ
ncbi:MAG: LamG domain-containing protein [Candidatus Sumerlaeia bacterium]|nr:LamG domain-containing protein [Candidatus Sumerlaeia bacterium]